MDIPTPTQVNAPPPSPSAPASPSAAASFSAARRWRAHPHAGGTHTLTLAQIAVTANRARKDIELASAAPPEPPLRWHGGAAAGGARPARLRLGFISAIWIGLRRFAKLTLPDPADELKDCDDQFCCAAK